MKHIHIIPVGDVEMHAAQQACWCHPTEIVPMLWQHNARDCREARERTAGEKCSEGWINIAECVEPTVAQDAWNAAIDAAAGCIIKDGNPMVALDRIKRLRRQMGGQMKPLNELTDAELSECFAVEVVGMFVHREGEITYTSWDKNPDFEKRNQRCEPLVPPFSTSADAVLPLLEKLVNRRAFNDHYITVTGENYYINGPSGTLSKATTLARAACIALIERKRRELK